MISLKMDKLIMFNNHAFIANVIAMIFKNPQDKQILDGLTMKQ